MCESAAGTVLNMQERVFDIMFCTAAVPVWSPMRLKADGQTRLRPAPLRRESHRSPNKPVLHIVYGDFKKFAECICL